MNITERMVSCGMKGIFTTNDMNNTNDCWAVEVLIANVAGY